MNRKVKITVIGYPKILSQCQEIAEEYLNSAHFLYYQYFPKSDSVKYMDASEGHPLKDRAKSFTDIAHDIIVVGIVTAKMMTMVDQNKIIPFRAGHKAIIKAFSKAKKIADRVAFISPVEEKHDTRFYEALTGLKIDIYYANDLNDYRRFCRQAKQGGHSVVVSGSYTFQIAREYGLKPVFLFSDDDIFHDAFSRALETFRYNQSLEEKVSQLEIISQKSEDCIVFIDDASQITFTNNATEQKLGLKTEEITGKHVSSVFGFVGSALLEKTEDSEIIGTLSGEQVLVTLHPVFAGLQTVGTVLFVKKTLEIAALDTRVRQKMRYRGFRARYTFKDILGNSATIKECREKALRYAASSAPVLIYGETGTGKELFAQSIHNASNRKPFSFVAINCATLPADLMESELFGYVKGAFTGARSRGKQGLVDQAHLGTLFLDEVDSLPLSLQAKLLRLLQEKEFIRVGGDEVIPVDIRVIAACNHRQEPDHQQVPGRDTDPNLIRRDLFYRLSVLYLELPDLARRREDILLLFIHFLGQSDPGLIRLMSDAPAGFTHVLNRHPFKGNLRELQSIATRFACLYDSTRAQETGYMEDLMTSCCNAGPNRENSGPTGKEAPDLVSPLDVCPGLPLSQSMALAEKAILQSSRQQHKGSVQSMADQLGIGRTTLWRKLKGHGII